MAMSALLPDITEPTFSHFDLLDSRAKAYSLAVSAGQIRPFIYPYDSFPAFLLILYLYFPLSSRYRSSHRLASNIYDAYVFVLIAWGSTSSIRACRSLLMANGYGIGLACTWCYVWAAAMILSRDEINGGEFMRVERVCIRDGDQNELEGRQDLYPVQNGFVKETDSGVIIDAARERVDMARLRRTEPERPKKEDKSLSNGDINGTSSKASALSGDESRPFRYIWQPHPQNHSHRLEWVLDLLSNFRGPGWNWRISSLPPLPPTVQSDLHLKYTPPCRSQDFTAVSENIKVPNPNTVLPSPTRYLFWTNLASLIYRYIALDILKVAMMKDPYFYGVGLSPSLTAPLTSAPSYLPPSITSSATFTKIYRLIYSVLGIYYALTSIFALGPLFFISILRPLHRYLRTPFADPFLYPSLFGPISAVLDNGLAGAWGTWWHQMFRHGFTAPSTALIRKLGWKPNEPRAKALQLLIAFLLSGTVHASASYTQFADTRPLTGPFAFFVLQAFGIMGSTYVAKVVLPRLDLPGSMKSRVVKRAANLVFVLVWFYVTGPLFADDLARGGIWTLEPVPFSVVRGYFGLGVDGEGWWCWGRGGWVGLWWERGAWWRSGLAV